MGAPSIATLRLNGITADFAAEVLRGPGNHHVELRPQAFAVLRHLAKNANRLVTKDELMEAVWPGIAVTDDSLVQCVHEIRRAIGDESHSMLRTVPKRGYRLDLPEMAATEIAAPASRPHARLLAGLALGVGVALLAAVFWWRGEEDVPGGAPPSLAVLPFDDLGSEPDGGYFADGITEDLITDLAQIPGVFVIARNSVWGYRDDRAVDVRAVATALGVRYVLEGSVRRNGDRVRINAQLIDAAAGHHVWADRYDGSLGDVFALQDQVIGQIVSALSVRLPTGDAPEGQAGTANPLAYDTLLRGRDALRRDTEADTLAAIALFEKAVALDPEYGQAYAALAAAQWRVVLSYWSATSGAGWQHAYEGLMHSLAEAKKRPSSLAYAVSAQLLSLQGRYDEAFSDIERAMALAPGDPETHIAKASILNATGRAAEAEAEVQIAMRADPHFAPASLRMLAISLFNQGKFVEAADVLDRLSAQGSDVVVDYSTLVSALGHLGRPERVPALVAKYNAMALPAAYDPLTVQESAWDWYGVAFDYHRPYLLQVQAGLRKAGVPEGAGTDLDLEDYAALISRNLGEFEVQGATKVTAAEARALHDRGVPFVDVRARLDYDNGHVPGAAHLSLVVDLSPKTLAGVAGPEDEVVFYCAGKYCPRSAYGAAKAVAWGYHKVYYFAGGFPAWQDAGYPVREAAGSQ